MTEEEVDLLVASRRRSSTSSFESPSSDRARAAELERLIDSGDRSGFAVASTEYSKLAMEENERQASSTMTEGEVDLFASLKKELASKDAIIKTKNETIKELIKTKDEAIKTKDEAVKAKDDILANSNKILAAKVLWDSLMYKLGAVATVVWHLPRCCHSEQSSNHREQHRRGDAVIWQAETQPSQTNRPTDLPRQTSCLGAIAAFFTLQIVPLGMPSFTGHPALVADDVFLRCVSFLDLKDFVTVGRTCHAWRQGTESAGNAYWRVIAHARWPEWASAIEAQFGKTSNFKNVCMEKLREEDHRRIEVWMNGPLEGFAWSCHAREKAVPLISWMSHQGHVTGSLAALSALSHTFFIPAPIFKRYENAALAMYDDARGYCWTFRDLPPIPSNITEKRRTDHERCREAIKAIFFKRDGRLMNKKPKFAYRSEGALWRAGTLERLSPTQILEGIAHLRSEAA
mmetsp:Transcript_31931/g.70171  ORF Transcript_31931/g.70171 Transcript_31931/m.70171 type:complete len:459 (-) Transcript_31931:985-2361(-)